MFEPVHYKNQLTIQMSSSWKKIGLAVLALGDFLETFDADEIIFARSGAVLREMLTNAIRHGNQSDSEKSIHVHITCLKNSVLCLSVEDEGEGFDISLLNTSAPPSSDKNRKRGLYLIRSLSDRVEFNTRGNAITAYLSTSDKSPAESDSFVQHDKPASV